MGAAADAAKLVSAFIAISIIYLYRSSDSQIIWREMLQQFEKMRLPGLKKKKLLKREGGKKKLIFCF